MSGYTEYIVFTAFFFIIVKGLPKIKYQLASNDYLKATGRFPLLLNHSTEGLFAKHITMKNYYEIEKALLGKLRNKKVDFIVNTYGGNMFASLKIAHLLRKFNNVRVVVPKYAWSGGTMIALGCDRIVADKNSIFGAVDPQVKGEGGYYSAKDVQEVIKRKKFKDIKDGTIVASHSGKQILKEVKGYVHELLEGRNLNIKKANNLLLEGNHSHANWVKAHDLQDIGFNIDDSHVVLSNANKIVNNMYGQDGVFLPMKIK